MMNPDQSILRQLSALEGRVAELEVRRDEAEEAAVEIGAGAEIAEFTGSATFEGEAETTGLNSDITKPWVKLVIATKTFTEETADPSDPWPAGTHWWRKAETFGDIHYWPAAVDKTLPFKIVFMFTGTEAQIASIPSEYGTFALCDGVANSVGNGGSGVNLSGRFIVGIGNDGDADNDTYAEGDTGGYQHHGNDGGTVGNVNNHTDHDLEHYHLYSPDDPPTQNAAAGADVWAWGADPTNASATCWGQTNNATWNGAGNIPGTDGLIVHSMTDNRPPFFALCFIERIS